jgi:hypothetical protein
MLEFRGREEERPFHLWRALRPWCAEIPPRRCGENRSAFSRLSESIDRRFAKAEFSQPSMGAVLREFSHARSFSSKLTPLV